jgi:hypothetical protein
MDKAEVQENANWVETNIDDFAQRVKGLPRAKYAVSPVKRQYVIVAL